MGYYLYACFFVAGDLCHLGLEINLMSQDERFSLVRIEEELKTDSKPSHTIRYGVFKQYLFMFSCGLKLWTSGDRILLINVE